MISFSAVDWGVVALYFAVLVAVVVWVAARRNQDSKDYFLASRNAGWVLIGCSIFASNIGSEHLVGLAGTGAQSGMAFAHWELHSYMILVLGWVFAPFYLRAGVFTTPEFLEKRYSPGTRTLLSAVFLLSYVLTKVSVTVYAGALVIKTVLGIETLFGVDFFWVAALGLVIVTGLYTVAGGMKAVLYTEAVQAPLLLFGSLLILFIGLDRIGGWDELARINEGAMHLWRPLSTTAETTGFPAFLFDPSETPWLGVLLASPIIGLWYWCTDQYIVQRVLSARDLKQARRGAIFAGYLKLFPVFIFLIPGMIAVALNEKGLISMESADQAFPLLVSTLLPSGIKGLVLAGLLAAVMSSLASLFNSSATLFTVDFYKRLKPASSEAQLVRIGRLATVVVVFLGIVWIPVMRNMADYLYAYLQLIQSLLAPAIAAVFMLGIFSRRMTAKAGFWGLAIGFGLGVLRLAMLVADRQFGVDFAGPAGAFVEINWLYFCAILFAVTCLVMWSISLVTPKPTADQVGGLTWGGATAEERAAVRASWDRWDVIHTIVVVAIVVGVYVVFW